MAALKKNRPSSLDTLTPKQRGERMSRVRAKGSKAEMAVRRLVHARGYR
jgi:DNA mismatch endonuclease (patch repair protein)